MATPFFKYTIISSTGKFLLALLPLLCLSTGIYWAVFHSARTRTAEQIPEKQCVVYQFGLAESFIGGAFTGSLALSDLLTRGNFGLGAPDEVDGELTFYNGRAYQTIASGKTIQAPGTLKLPFAMITIFKPSHHYRISEVKTLASLFDSLQKMPIRKSGAYSIRVEGTFSSMTTRAFESTKGTRHRPLNELLNKQHFFTHVNTPGILIGFYMPAHLSGVTIKGFHFHFLSSDFQVGGHVVKLAGENLKISLAGSSQFCVQTPENPEFESLQSPSENSLALQQIEKGSR